MALPDTDVCNVLCEGDSMVKTACIRLIIVDYYLLLICGPLNYKRLIELVCVVVFKIRGFKEEARRCCEERRESANSRIKNIAFQKTHF